MDLRRDRCSFQFGQSKIREGSMMLLKIKLLPIWALMAFPALPAHAVLYDFRYIASNGVLSGRVNGLLQADRNTLHVTSVRDAVSFNNLSGPVLNFTSFSGFLGGSATPAILTINGLSNDFIACSSADCSDGILVDGIATGPFAFINSSASFGNISERYHAAKWSMTSPEPLPEPRTWALMIAGLGLVGGALRRRRQNTNAPSANFGNIAFEV